MRRDGVTDVGGMVTGGCVVLLGVLLLLDQLGVLHLGFGWGAPAVLAVAGVALVAAGLEGPRSQ